MKLGDVLKKEREKKGLSVSEVASRLKISEEEYREIEAGETAAESWGPRLAQIAIKLETPTSRLLAESGRFADTQPGQAGGLIRGHRERRDVAELAVRRRAVQGHAVGVEPVHAEDPEHDRDHGRHSRGDDRKVVQHGEGEPTLVERLACEDGDDACAQSKGRGVGPWGNGPQKQECHDVRGQEHDRHTVGAHRQMLGAVVEEGTTGIRLLRRGQHRHGQRALARDGQVTRRTSSRRALGRDGFVPHQLSPPAPARLRSPLSELLPSSHPPGELPEKTR